MNCLLVPSTVMAFCWKLAPAGLFINEGELLQPGLVGAPLSETDVDTVPLVLWSVTVSAPASDPSVAWLDNVESTRELVSAVGCDAAVLEPVTDVDGLPDPGSERPSEVAGEVPLEASPRLETAPPVLKDGEMEAPVDVESESDV